MPVLLAFVAALPAVPTAEDVERNLRQREFCFATIDACLDGETGQQIVPSTEFKVTSLACKKARKPAGRDAAVIKRSARCRFSTKQTNWMEGQQVGEARTVKQTAVYDLVSFTVMDGDREVLPIQYSWRQRSSSR